MSTEYGLFETMVDGTGVTEVPVEGLEEALAKLKLDETMREALQKDIDSAYEEGDDYVQYYCY